MQPGTLVPTLESRGWKSRSCVVAQVKSLASELLTELSPPQKRARQLLLLARPAARTAARARRDNTGGSSGSSLWSTAYLARKFKPKHFPLTSLCYARLQSEVPSLVPGRWLSPQVTHAGQTNQSLRWPARCESTAKQASSSRREDQPPLTTGHALLMAAIFHGTEKSVVAPGGGPPSSRAPFLTSSAGSTTARGPVGNTDQECARCTRLNFDYIWVKSQKRGRKANSAK